MVILIVILLLWMDIKISLRNYYLCEISNILTEHHLEVCMCNSDHELHKKTLFKTLLNYLAEHYCLLVCSLLLKNIIEQVDNWSLIDMKLRLHYFDFINLNYK
jgi:Gpi18-like mannosyltransferase